MNIDNETQYFGVLGHPVGHSKSPLVFNKLFENFDYNGCFHFIEQKDSKKAIDAIRTLNFRGISVTIPHKEEVVKYLDWIDPLAAELGCINTIYNDGGLLKGYNYDGYGAIEGLEKIEPNWFEKKILFIGNGGAARGISLSMCLSRDIKHLYFLVREPRNLDPLKKQLELKGVKVEVFSFGNDDDIIKNLYIDIVINTTPLGMAPHIDKTPFSSKWIKSSLTVYDIVYNPKETRLLKEAKEKGSKVIYGDAMFIGQAALQFKLWTKLKADKNLMSDILR